MRYISNSFLMPVSRVNGVKMGSRRQIRVYTFVGDINISFTWRGVSRAPSATLPLFPHLIRAFPQLSITDYYARNTVLFAHDKPRAVAFIHCDVTFFDVRQGPDTCWGERLECEIEHYLFLCFFSFPFTSVFCELLTSFSFRVLLRNCIACIIV